MAKRLFLCYTASVNKTGASSRDPEGKEENQWLNF